MLLETTSLPDRRQPALLKPLLRSSMADRGGDRGGFSRGFGRGRGEGGRGDRGRGDRGRGPRRAPKKDEDQPWVPTTKLGRLVQQARTALRVLSLRAAALSGRSVWERERVRAAACACVRACVLLCCALRCPAWEPLRLSAFASRRRRSAGACLRLWAQPAGRSGVPGTPGTPGNRRGKPSSPSFVGLAGVARCAGACTPLPRRRGLACDPATPAAPGRGSSPRGRRAAARRHALCRRLSLRVRAWRWAVLARGRAPAGWARPATRASAPRPACARPAGGV
jgi:hypothetical protein